MSKKMLKRSLVLGALMAFVITGSAFAEVVDVNQLQQDSVSVESGKTVNYNSGIKLLDKNFINDGTVNVTGSLIFDETKDSEKFTNNGVLNTDILDVYSRQEVTFAGRISATDKFIWRGRNGDAALNDSLELITPKLEIIGDMNDATPNFHSARLIVSSNDVLKNVDDILVASNGAEAILVVHYGANVKYDKTITLQSSNAANSEACIMLYNDSSIELDKLIVDGSEGRIQYSFDNDKTPGSATVKNIEIKDGGNLVLRQKVYSGSPQIANFNITNIKMGQNSRFVSYVPQDIVAMNLSGDVTMDLAKGSVVDFGAYTVDKEELGNNVFVNFGNMTINAQDETARVYLSNAAQESDNGLQNENIKVISTAELEKIKDVVWRTEETKGSEATEQSKRLVAEGVQLVQQTNSVEDTVAGTVAVDSDDQTQSIVINKSSSKNPDTFGVAENNALSLITWRAEINDMNKRMGELRNANGEHGVWVRMVRGEDEYESINHQYNQYQLGYDEKLSVDPSWTVGVALSYTEGDSTYSTGSAENKHKGFSVYGSKLNDDGTFIDLIAKYARLENDFDTTWGTGDYSTNGYSVSAEFGKRIQQGKGVWVEPQVELTYGKVSAVDYKIGNVAVAQDGIESLVGRVGFSLGKDIKQGNVYARASYLYDFDGETSANFVDTVSGGKPRTLNDDLGGGWWEVGVGANINLSKATYIYADVEKTFGGEVDTNWQWNLGVRYSF